MRKTEETRERLLAYVSTLRSALTVNAKASPNALCSVCGVSKQHAGAVVDVGVISPLPDATGWKWESKATDSEIVDLLIQHRRRQDGPMAGMTSETEEKIFKALNSLAEESGTHALAIGELRKKCDEGFSREDRELLNLALDDRNALKVRVEQLETIVGNMLRLKAAQEPPTNGTRPAAPVVPAAPPKPAKKLKFLVFGVWPRDARHVLDYMKLGLGDRWRDVELDIVSPDDRRQLGTNGYEAVITTPDVDKCVRDAHWREKSVPMFRVPGGNRAVADQIVELVAQHGS